MTREIDLSPKNITICGTVSYERAANGHSLAQLAVFDYKYTALLFKVTDKYLTSAAKEHTERSPFEVNELMFHLLHPIRDHIEVPMLRVIGESFEVEDILETWTIQSGYVKHEDVFYRAYVMKPPEKDLREPYEYVTHLLARHRRNDPLKIEFTPN